MRGRVSRLALAAVVAFGLAACGQSGGDGKTDASSAERISAALDPCAEGRGDFAARVCSDRELSALEAQLRDTLVQRAGEVSDAGAQLLVQNQNRWLNATRIECGIADGSAEPTNEQRTCLQNQLRARASDAANTVQEVGGYTFQRMELVDATPVTDDLREASGLGEYAPAAIVRNIRFPRIDGAQTPAIERFNQLVAQEPQYRFEDATNETVDYRISYAGPEIISVRFDSSADTLGAAHPSGSSKAVTVMMTDGRLLTAADVFRPETAWQDFLTTRSVQALTRQFRDEDFSPPERDVRETATKAHLWLISENGLTILFPPYSFGGPYVMGGTEVTIPWADLRPYLNPAAPAPIRPAA